MICRLFLSAVIGISASAAWPAVAAAQDESRDHSPPSSSEDPTNAPGVSPEEEELLREALGEDLDEEDEGAAPDAMGQQSDPPAQPGRFGSRAGSAVQSMNPDISVILDAAAARFSDSDHLQTGAHDPTRNGFNLQQLELAIESSVDPFFAFNAYIVFGVAGVEVEEAYGTTLSLPLGLQLRAGQFLHRIGRINATHPHAWHFVDQSLVIGKFFGSEGSRGLGVETSWLLPLPWYVEAALVVSDAVGGCCARSYYGNEDLGVDGLNDLLYTATLKQFFALDDSWSIYWGLSGQFGPNPTGLGNRSSIYGTDLYLRYRPVRSTHRASLSLQLEGLYRQRQVPGDLLEDYGGYAQLVWQPRIRWETGLRYEFASGVEEDYLDPEWTDPRHRYTAQVTFYPSHFSRIRLQHSIDDPKWREAPVHATFLALELLVGAHGAHAF